jgi:hypothetical protein
MVILSAQKKTQINKNTRNKRKKRLKLQKSTHDFRKDPTYGSQHWQKRKPPP